MTDCEKAKMAVAAGLEELINMAQEADVCPNCFAAQLLYEAAFFAQTAKLPKDVVEISLQQGIDDANESIERAKAEEFALRSTHKGGRS